MIVAALRHPSNTFAADCRLFRRRRISRPAAADRYLAVQLRCDRRVVKIRDHKFIAVCRKSITLGIIDVVVSRLIGDDIVTRLFNKDFSVLKRNRFSAESNRTIDCRIKRLICFIIVQNRRGNFHCCTDMRIGNLRILKFNCGNAIYLFDDHIASVCRRIGKGILTDLFGNDFAGCFRYIRRCYRFAVRVGYDKGCAFRILAAQRIDKRI